VAHERKPEGRETHRHPREVGCLQNLVGAREGQQLGESVHLAEEYDHLHYEDE